eukprot:jgi/Chrzof1/8163/Cz03g00030.t1
MHLRCGNGNAPMHLRLETMPPGRAGGVCTAVGVCQGLEPSGAQADTPPLPALVVTIPQGNVAALDKRR